ncbi:MAG: hypothetical protein MUO63_13440, partial [Desulfobulbaceae bacterium]|nr:hypothetical protein [Desulfobulbaceae bacterium]
TQEVDSPDLLVWIIVLLVQSVPYVAAVIVSLVSGFARLPKKLIHDMTTTPDLTAKPESTAPAK